MCCLRVLSILTNRIPLAYSPAESCTPFLQVGKSKTVLVLPWATESSHTPKAHERNCIIWVVTGNKSCHNTTYLNISHILCRGFTQILPQSADVEAPGPCRRAALPNLGQQHCCAWSGAGSTPGLTYQHLLSGDTKSQTLPRALEGWSTGQRTAAPGTPVIKEKQKVLIYQDLLGGEDE